MGFMIVGNPCLHVEVVLLASDVQARLALMIPGLPGLSIRWGGGWGSGGCHVYVVHTNICVYVYINTDMIYIYINIYLYTYIDNICIYLYMNHGGPWGVMMDDG